MKLKNVLIAVDDIKESIRFYKEIFGLQVILQQEGNVILSEGLVLQDAKIWNDTVDGTIMPYNNMTELYFEHNNLEELVDRLTSGDYYVATHTTKRPDDPFGVKFVTELTELDGGQKMVRFYDPSGNLIEVRTPVNYN